jgi:hypothetical protein
LKIATGDCGEAWAWLAADADEPELTADHMCLLSTIAEAIDVTLAKTLRRSGGTMASDRAHMPLIW